MGRPHVAPQLCGQDTPGWANARERQRDRETERQRDRETERARANTKQGPPLPERLQATPTKLPAMIGSSYSFMA